MTDRAEYYITFHYNDLGRGRLIILNGSAEVMSKKARCGSMKFVEEKLTLINPTPNGRWLIKQAPVDTTETGMTITEGKGWKVRLYKTDGEFTHYLIHPDGGKGGSLGCIVTPKDDALDLRERIEQILKKQPEIKVFVNCEAFGVHH